MIHPDVAQHIPEIRALCREFGVSKLEIFGSAVTGEFDPERSDVDFLVTYPEEYDFGDFGARVFQFEERLSNIVGREVDIVFNNPPRNRFFARDIDRTRQDIYVANGPSGDASTPDAERTGATARVRPRLAHQRTLKLLEDIRLSCVDIEELAKEIATTSSLPDRLARDATAWSIQKTGRTCKRLADADVETASRIDHLATMIELNDQLAYGSGMDVDNASLHDVMHSIIPEIRKAVTSLIGRLEREEQPAFTGTRA